MNAMGKKALFGGWKRDKAVLGDKKSRSRLVRELFEIFGELELLKADWPQYVKRAEQGAGAGGTVYGRRRSCTGDGRGRIAAEWKETQDETSGDLDGTADGIFCIYLFLWSCV